MQNWINLCVCFLLYGTLLSLCFSILHPLPQIEHTLQWAREWFEEVFTQTPEDVQRYLTSDSLKEFSVSLAAQQNMKLGTRLVEIIIPQYLSYTLSLSNCFSLSLCLCSHHWSLSSLPIYFLSCHALFLSITVHRYGFPFHAHWSSNVVPLFLFSLLQTL